MSITLEAALPLVGKSTQEPMGAAFSHTINRLPGTLDFPLLMIARLPHFLKRDDFAAGILSGRLAFSHTLRNPELIGDAQLIDGRFRDHSVHPFSRAAAPCSRGKKRKYEFANLQSGDGVARIRGEVDLTNSEEDSKFGWFQIPRCSIFRVPPRRNA